jgi:hypothetical protein
MSNDIRKPGSLVEYARLLERLKHSFISAANMKRRHNIGRSDNSNSAISAEFGLDVDEDAELIAIITQVRKEQASMVKTFDSEYEKVVAEAFAVWDKMFAKYMPELCEALYREQPRLKERGIKRRIVDELIDIYPGIINDRYLRAWTIQK